MHHQLRATANLHKLDELPHLHLSHTFTYYWPPHFRILSNYTSPNYIPHSALYYIFVAETPSLTSLRFSHGWSWRRPRGQTSPMSTNFLHTCLYVLFNIWLSTLSEQRGLWVAYNWEDVPVASHIRPGHTFPIFHPPPAPIFPYRSTYIQSVGTVSMEIEVTWALHEASIDSGLARLCHTNQF